MHMAGDKKPIINGYSASFLWILYIHYVVMTVILAQAGLYVHVVVVTHKCSNILHI